MKAKIVQLVLCNVVMEMENKKHLNEFVHFAKIFSNKVSENSEK